MDEEMAKDFLTHFMANATKFFTSDLPMYEETYDAYYSLLMTDWRAIQAEYLLNKKHK